MAEIFLTIVFSLGILLAVVVVYGAFRWKSATREMRVRLEAAHGQTQPQVVLKKGAAQQARQGDQRVG